MKWKSSPFVVQILKLDRIENRAIDEFFRPEPVIDHRPALEILQRVCIDPRLLPGVRWSVLNTVIKLALVLDHHAGAKLCGFHAAHNFLRTRSAGLDCSLSTFLNFEDSCKRTVDLRTAARGMTRGTLARIAASAG